MDARGLFSTLLEQHNCKVIRECMDVTAIINGDRE